MEEVRTEFIFLLTLFFHQTHGWHSFGNTPYHCWPSSASAANPTPITCSGVSIEWLVPPPTDVVENAAFNVTYALSLDSTFYTWAINNGYFGSAGGTGFTDATAAQTWCETTNCPDYTTATEINCCVHHVNVHSCPLDQTSNSLCGPWIPDDGAVFTHSQVLVGSVSVQNWTSYIPGLYQTGINSIIAHFKVADLHVVLEAKTTVNAKSDCGNGACETEDGEDCETCPKDCGTCPLKDWQIALIATAGILILLAAISTILYFQYQKRKLLWDESWILPYEDIKEDAGLRGAFGSMVSMTCGSGQDLTGKSNNMAMSALRKQVFAKTAIVDGRTVAVRNITKKEFSVNDTIRWEVKSVRELDHQNICKFVGGCIDVPNVSIVCEYCPKGSISDVLLNDEIPLNWAFRFSFAADIARGMDYLHSKKIMHGRLKSSNCVVDDRWTVKISDYGLKEYRRQDKIITEDDDDNEADEYYKKMRERVYKAPELFDLNEYESTAPLDVYAYSIILIEIATRNDPYEDEDPFDLPDRWKPPLPDLSREAADDADSACPCPAQYIQLIKDCWDDNPLKRPSFENAKRSLHVMNPNKMSPVDLMMAMMEKYSKHLEAIVADRTQDLMLEKQKTDRLLYSMLPRTVADDLKYGRTINAEQFEACTIYFSDIVGFTSISGGSTPMQVVALLNHLYITFDGIIDKYDVYKVETIGDAYMVVSGIPNRTVFHAREVSNMALDLVAACKVFEIPHRPNDPLKIRVGLHSGPACAGVVGLKMPRYCLFGDTVNTASRMESNGEAYKVHISQFTYQELKKYGGFKFELRGTIPVKGKGDMETWWLLDRDDTYEKLHGSLPSKPHQSEENLIENKDKLSKSQKSIRTSDKRNTSRLGETIAEQNDRITENGLLKNEQNVTPVELPDPTKTRKISNISTSNDSGYNEKADEDPTNVHEIIVQSCDSLRDAVDSGV
ncbi:atrial natriuretic peptide receptor 2-like [Argopecten irradians]|uniref:atrial natriuretic peptide receptor 2-like n=1 Tax=Argopecten irradians TaxID=31199 RepID=UPI0037151BC2